MNVTINTRLFTILAKRITSIEPQHAVIWISVALSIGATTYAAMNNTIIAYGDAESHLNISKRVVHSITPGFAQLGGIWLPLPHLLMTPFTAVDFLWRTGIAGSIVAGGAYVVTSVMLYKLTLLITKKSVYALTAFALFATNPNILYMQATPMSELPLIALSIVSTYFFIKFVRQQDEIVNLVLASFFGFCATLTRYDGWFLVLFEALLLIGLYIRKRSDWPEMKGKVILFCTLAFFGIALWMLWDYLILGDPFYFTNSQFSAKTQQMNWLARGELPSYHNVVSAIVYYSVTAMSNIGTLPFMLSIIGLVSFMSARHVAQRYMIAVLLMIPFIFNIFTLFLGQSVIFIPHLTPVNFEWRLFNVRYGLLMVPAAAFFIAFLLSRVSTAARVLIISLCIFQFALFGIGYTKVITLADGTEGLSSAKHVSAQDWIYKNYDSGLVLIDDYARSVSVIRSGVPMTNIIYIGNKPYWDESLIEPEKYVQWVIMQKDDIVWKHLIDNPNTQARLYKYFQKVYTSEEILIFKRIDASRASR